MSFKQVGRRLWWAAIGGVHVFLAFGHLVVLPGTWAANDLWKGLGALAGALLMFAMAAGAALPAAGD